MPRPLTKAERYQFGLTGSQARTLAAQRAAIARCGLTNATPASVLAARRQAFAAWRQRPDNADLAKLPTWLAAARYRASGDDWRHLPPVKAGTCRSAKTLAVMAYKARDWGLLRKHDVGSATAFTPRVRELDNGKTGWDRVVERFADYLCVLSPDETQVAIQIDREPIVITRVWRGRCIFRGQVVNLRRLPPTDYTRTARDQTRYLRRQGFAARLVRQTDTMLQAGSGETLRKGGQLHCVVPDGLSGWYHVPNYMSINNLVNNLRARRLQRRDKELLARLNSEAERTWVTVQDSLTAGNCEPATRSFVRTLQEKLGATGEIGAVRADYLLGLRRDNYVTRACQVALLRR